MPNNNGDLYFAAGIDIEKFNLSAEAMQKRMAQTASSVVHSSDLMDQALHTLGSTFAMLAGTAGIMGFTKQVFNVRSEMQNTEAMLRVFLGSAEKANDFFRDLQGYAYNNVFEFADLAKQSAQLLAYKTNVEDVIPTLNKLSEIAAGTNVPLAELVNTFNKVKSNDRLDSMAIISLGAKGIDVKQVLADIKTAETGQQVLRSQVETTGLKFKDLMAVIDQVSTGEGMFAGMMQEKMKTLGDSWGLMQDNLTNMFNEIGELTQDWLKGGMNVANTLIENYQEVAKILGILVVAYGSTKAANIAMNAAQKSGTGITILDNLAWQSRAKLLKQEITGSKDVVAITKERTKAQQEEIATLRAQLSDGEHATMINQARLASLDNILTAEQQQQLAQQGITRDSEEYLAVATNMLDKDQQIALAKSELTENSQTYIDTMRDTIAAREETLQKIDEEIDRQKNLVEIAGEEVNVAQQEVDTIKNKIATLCDERDQYEANGDAEMANTTQTQINTETEALNTAQAKLNTAEQKLNTIETDLNTASQQRQAIATGGSTAAIAKDTIATRLWTSVKTVARAATTMLNNTVKALWTTIKANPLGLILTIGMAIYGLVKKLIGEQEEELDAMRDFNAECQKQFNNINSLQVALENSERGTALYKNTIKETNKLCKEYNVTLINENDTLEVQREKYKNLKRAVEEATAAKIKDKYQDKINEKVTEASNDASEKLSDMLDSRVMRRRFGLKAKDISEASKDRAMMGINLEAERLAREYKTYNVEYVKAIQKSSKELAEQLITANPIKGENAQDRAKRVTGAAIAISRAMKGMANTYRDANEETKKLNETFDAFAGTAEHVEVGSTTNAEKIKQWSEELKNIQQTISEFRKSDKAWKDDVDSNEEIKNVLNREKELVALIKQHGGSAKTLDELKKNTASTVKSVVDLAKGDLEAELDMLKAELDMLEDGIDKEIAQFEYDRKVQLMRLQQSDEEIRQKLKDKKLSEEAANKMLAANDLYRKKAEKELTNINARTLDKQIDYMKTRYEQYYEWLELLGEESAQKQFAGLMAQGRTFSEWVEMQALLLDEKLADPTLDPELRKIYSANRIQLARYQDENNVDESSSDRFVREADQRIEQASTLAAKIAEIQNTIASISKDETLNDQQRLDLAKAYTRELQNQINAEKRRQQELLIDPFKERNERLTQYQSDIQALIDAGRDVEANAMQSEMDSYRRQFDTDWLKNLFSEAFSSEATKKAIKQGVNSLKDIRNLTVDEFNKKFGTELDETQFSKLQEDADELISTISQPLKAPIVQQIDSIKEAFAGGDFEKGFEGIQNVMSLASNVLSQFSSSLDELAEASGNQNLKKVATTLNKASETLTTIGSFTALGAQIGGGYGAAAGAIIGGALSVFTLGAKASAEREQARQQKIAEGVENTAVIIDRLTTLIDATQQLSDTFTSLSYDTFKDSLHDFLYTLNDQLQRNNYDNTEELAHSIRDAWEGSTYNRLVGLFSQDFIDALNQNYEQNQAQLGNHTYIDENGFRTRFASNLVSSSSRDRDNTLETVQQLRDDFRILSESFGNIPQQLNQYILQAINPDNLNRQTGYNNIGNPIGWGIAQYIEDKTAELQEVQDQLREMMSSNSYDAIGYTNIVSRTIAINRDMAEASRLAAQLSGNLEQAESIARDIADMDYQLSQQFQNILQSYWGTDLQSIVYDWIDIFQEFGDNVEGAFAKIDEGIDQLIYNFLQKKIVIQPLLESMSNLIDQYVNSDGTVSEEQILDATNALRSLKQEAYDNVENLNDTLARLGLDMNNLLADPTTLTGSIQNVSEETAGIIAGRMNAIVINQSENNSIIRQSLLLQSDMRDYLRIMQADLAEVKINMTNYFDDHQNEDHP